jgi:hypothetical protein
VRVHLGGYFARFILAVSLAVAPVSWAGDAPESSCAIAYAKFTPSSDFKNDPGLVEMAGGLRLQKMDVQSNYAVYKALNSDDEVVAVFKGEASEDRSFRRAVLSWDWTSGKKTIEDGGYSKRVAAFYGLGKKLDLSVVTPSAPAVTNSGAEGSLMRFLKGYQVGTTADPATLAKVSKDQAQEMYLFNTLVGRGDDHPGNWMVSPEGDLKVIDPDRLLHNVEKLRWNQSTPIESVFPQAAGQVSATTKAKFLSLTAEDLDQILREYGIPDEAIDFTAQRLANIQEALRNNEPIEKIAKDNSILSRFSIQNGVQFLMGKKAGAAITHEVDTEENLGALNAEKLEFEAAPKPHKEESEAKFVIPSQKTMDELKGLIGQTIELTDSSGKTIRYRVAVTTHLQQDDVYYDTASLSLLEKQGTLRKRLMYVKKPNILYKARFEAKSGPQSAAEGVMVRSQAKGASLPRNEEKREALATAQISDPKSTDKAVKFARDYAAGDQPLQPVLNSREDRIYLGLYPIDAGIPGRFFPAIHISLDTVSYQSLLGSKTDSLHLGSEVELARGKNSPELQQQLSQLMTLLRDRYHLEPTDKSNYVQGMSLSGQTAQK